MKTAASWWVEWVKSGRYLLEPRQGAGETDVDAAARDATDFGCCTKGLMVKLQSPYCSPCSRATKTEVECRQDEETTPVGAVQPFAKLLGDSTFEALLTSQL